MAQPGGRPGTKEGAGSRYRIHRRARGQAARGVCSKQFQLTYWNWNRTCTRWPGWLSAPRCHSVENDENMSIPSPIALSHFSLSSNIIVMLYARKSDVLDSSKPEKPWYKNWLKNINQTFFTAQFNNTLDSRSDHNLSQSIKLILY